MTGNKKPASELSAEVRPAKSQDSDLAASISSTKGPDFELERYKFILQELRSLNDDKHRYLTLFQTLATVIVAGGVILFVSWESFGVAADVARTAMQALVALLVLVGLFTILSIVAGIFSWFDYRNEEVDLLDVAVGEGFRDRPSARNFWRWTETYMIAFIILAVIAIVLVAEVWIIPQM